MELMRKELKMSCEGLLGLIAKTVAMFGLPFLIKGALEDGGIYAWLPYKGV